MTHLNTKTYKLLKNYRPSFPEEVVFKSQMLEVVLSLEDCFLRTCRVGHFTASSLVLNQEKTHVFLMHHTKYDKWLQPGGHCDGDSDVLRVALKETEEESGIQGIQALKEDIFDLGIHLIPPNKKEKGHYHFDIRFLLHASKGNNYEKNHESKDVKWVPLDEVHTLSPEKSMKRMITKAHDLFR